MLELFRMVQLQMESRYAQKATSSKAKADALDQLLEESKPASVDPNWDTLIATPFRYDLPVDPPYAARFKPPFFNRNAWYGAAGKEVAAFEVSYHFLKQRVHLDIQDRGHRTMFSCECDVTGAWDICGRSDIAAIMDRKSYSKSYEIAEQAKVNTGILYPSSRDPKNGLCAVMYELSAFAKEIKNERTVHFEYENGVVKWYRHHYLDLVVDWQQVC